MTSNYYENGYNDGYGYDWKNNDDDHPITNSGCGSYQIEHRERCTQSLSKDYGICTGGYQKKNVKTVKDGWDGEQNKEVIELVDIIEFLLRNLKQTKDKEDRR